jgi:hypothetical protein
MTLAGRPTRESGVRLRRRSLIALALLAPALGAWAQAERPRESLVKAAFLHKFASFVEWPAGSFPRADSPLRIGIRGDDQVWRDLRVLAHDRDRDGRPVVVTRLAAGEPLDGYHILYLRAAVPARITELLAGVPEGVLTVADSDGAHPKGAVLSFFVEDGRVRFGVSMDAAARQKLHLSSRLLSVARSVQGAWGRDDRSAAGA